MNVARAVLLLAMLPLATPAAAQQRISLDGTWSLQREQDGAAAGPTLEVQVPAAFETALGTDFDGVAWYRRELPVPDEHAGRVRVEFGAVATAATVFCNGVQVGSHLGGWTPFRVDVTEALHRPGKNVLEVRVDEKVGHNTQGFLPIVQPHFGGIWQSVTLCLDSGPALDRLGLTLFGRHRPVPVDSAPFELSFTVPALDAAGATAAIELLGVDVGGRAEAALGAGQPFAGTLTMQNLRPWSPLAPQLYTVRITLWNGATEVDRIERRIGFRDLRADGTKVLWNSAPLQLRGVLHWGYSPPHLAPPTDEAFWRRQLEDFKSLGFNCIKCCLWVPPRCVYELCDALGLLVWQEYPTWHPKLDQAHKDELLTEYGEFFVHDRSHPSVAFRSITCETGQGADLDVVTALYNACKAAVPDTLVVDDSSWIGWQRITDFWDEHPYGNNSWFPGRLEDFRRHIAEKGEKPLLLGECIAADTWFDRGAWDARHQGTTPWWRPTCYQAQVAAEAWLTQEYGADFVRRLLPNSLQFGLANRKFQIEQLRLRIPEAGYVVSVARDIPKCRMGLYDEQDRLKWSAADWAWHGDTMLCLDLPWNGRVLGPAASIPVRVAHSGIGPLQGNLRIWAQTLQGEEVRADVKVAPGEVSAALTLPLAIAPEQLRRVRVHAELTGSHTARNHWDLWQAPALHYASPGPQVQFVDHLTTAVLDELQRGGRVVLMAGEVPGSIRTESMWFLKGAPFAVPHPLSRRVPQDALLDLAAFDLETGRVMPWDLLRGEVDPILAFWETHDIPEVRLHLYAFDCRVGEGRLLATTLRLDERAAPNTLAMHLQHEFAQHLLHGPAPTHALSKETLAALRGKLDEKKIDLPLWHFRTDPADQGRAAGWQTPGTDVAGADWRDLRAGAHWENQAKDLEHYTGIAWYRVDVDVPADWNGLDARAVFEGVDDSFELWLDGQPAGSFGDPATGRTVWLERQVAELGQRLPPGRHTLVLRVVDHAGAGGLWKPVFLTTGPTDARSRLLH